MSRLCYQLYFSHKRKTIGLQVKQGQLIVRAPDYLSEAQVEAFVDSKKSWIEQKLALSKSVTESTTPLFNYRHGECLFIFGKERTLIVRSLTEQDDIKQTALLNENELVITLPHNEYVSSEQREYIKQHLQQWFNQQIKQYVLKVLPLFEQQMQLYCQDIKFRIYKSRWGSCNSRKQLTFNSLLTMAPPYVIDYVIIHELAHLKYMNHSAQFWQLVAKHCANVDKAKSWLKKYQKQLHLPQ